MRNAKQLRSNIEDAIATAGAIEDKLDDWCIDALGSQSNNGTASDSKLRASIGVLRIASIYCYILLHQTLLKTTLGTPFFDHCYDDAVQYTSRFFFQLESLKLLELKSFWFSCEFKCP